jgi:hypothetical protein
MKKYDVPLALTPSRLQALYHLWVKGKNWSMTDDPGERRALAELVSYGYAERDPEWRWNVRITMDGIDRLLAPMRLCNHVLGPVRQPRKPIPQLRRVK